MEQQALIPLLQAININLDEIKNLSLPEQIQALTSVSKFGTYPNQVLIEWQAALNRLYKDAVEWENDLKQFPLLQSASNRLIQAVGYGRLLDYRDKSRSKLSTVKACTKATQDLLRDPEKVENQEAFLKMLIDLSETASISEELKRDAIAKGVYFLVAVISGIILAMAATNPITLGFFVLVMAALCFANFYKSENPHGRLAGGIFELLKGRGFFDSTEARLVTVGEKLINCEFDNSEQQLPNSVSNDLFPKT